MSYLRHPKTTQERRRWYADTDLVKEYPELKLRLCRSSHLLPDTYDDLIRSSNDRSWKRHRKTQWGVLRADGPKKKGQRGTFDTPFVEMHKGPYWHWGYYMRRGMKNKFPFRVRFKYIKNKTS